MQQPFEVRFQLHEHTEARELGHLALDDVANNELRRDLALPWVGRGLFHAERHTLPLLIDAQHHGLGLVAFLENLRRMADLLRPGHVGDVQQSVDAFFELDEGPVVGQISNAPNDAGARRVLLLDKRPRIRFRLLHAEGDLLLLLVDAQHRDFHRIADGDDL